MGKNKIVEKEKTKEHTEEETKSTKQNSTSIFSCGNILGTYLNLSCKNLYFTIPRVPVSHQTIATF